MLIRKEASASPRVTARVFGSTTLMPATSCAEPSAYSFAPLIERSFDWRGLAVALARMPFMVKATSSAVRSEPSLNLASARVKVKVRPSIFQALASAGFGSKVSGLRRTSSSKSIFTRQSPSDSLETSGLIVLASPSVPMRMLPPGLPGAAAVVAAMVVAAPVVAAGEAALVAAAAGAAVAAVVAAAVGALVAAGALVAVGLAPPQAARIAAAALAAIPPRNARRE